MRLMLFREFREGWRSFRLPGLLLLAMFFAILEPPAQKYMGVILEMFAEGMVIELPPVSSEAAFLQFAGDLNSMVLIASIIVTMGIVAREKNNGLTEWFLTRPVSKKTYILSKATYLVVTTCLIVALSSLVCAFYTHTLIGPLDPMGVFLAIVIICTQLLLPLMLTLAVSAITGVAGVAAGAGIMALFLMSSFDWLMSRSQIDWLPLQLNRWLPGALEGSSSPSLWIAVGLSWVLILLLIVITQADFARREV